MSNPFQSPNSDELKARDRIAALMARYGDGTDGSSPTAAQWSRLFEGDASRPVTVINFFALRAVAHYEGEKGAPESPGSGGEAMMRYAAVSGPALEKVGGRFLLTAPYEASLMGEEERWDLVAIGSYPSHDALLALFEDEDYAAAFCHRRAATERQRVVMVTG